MSVDKYSYLTARPSLKHVGRRLADGIRRRQGENRPIIQVIRDTDSRMRLRMSGLRGEVLRGRRFWELIYVDATLVEVDMEDPMEHWRESSAAPSGSALQSAIAEPRQVFELGIVVSGRFSAGGKPADLRGYGDDFEAKGYGEELGAYADGLLADIKSILDHTVETTFDQRSGGIVPNRGAR